MLTKSTNLIMKKNIMSKQAILEIISLNKKINIGINEKTITYDKYMTHVKPLIDSFKDKYLETPNLFLQEYLKNLKEISSEYALANYGYRGRNSINDFSWSCFHFKYEHVTQHYASYSPQLYILVHSRGIKFGIDYGSQIHDNDLLVTEVSKRPDIINEIIKCNSFIPAYSLTEGASYLASESDRIEFNNENDVKTKWRSTVHLIKQFQTNDIPENIDEIINDSLSVLIPLFKKLCAITIKAYSDVNKTPTVSESSYNLSEDIEEKDYGDYNVDNFLSEVFVEEKDALIYQNLLLRKKNIILQGPPGTGKTFVAKRLAYLLLGKKKKNNIRTIQFHQSYAYEDFIQGFRPNKNAGFSKQEGVFYNIVQDSIKNPREKYVIIIDEINRGNLSKIFGELLMLIESDKRGSNFSINLIYEPEKEFYIPENLYIIGTMNTADRSLAIVDYALRRRFAFLDIYPNFGENLKSFLSLKGVTNNLINHITNSFITLNEKIIHDDNLRKGFCIGHSYFCDTPDVNTSEKDWYNNIILYEIGPILREYWFDDFQKAESLIESLLL